MHSVSGNNLSTAESRTNSQENSILKRFVASFPVFRYILGKVHELLLLCLRLHVAPRAEHKKCILFPGTTFPRQNQELIHHVYCSKYCKKDFYACCFLVYRYRYILGKVHGLVLCLRLHVVPRAEHRKCIPFPGRKNLVFSRETSGEYFR
jgi:hypothetical protein